MKLRRFVLPVVLLAYADLFPLCNWWQRILLYIAAAAGIDFVYSGQGKKGTPAGGPVSARTN